MKIVADTHLHLYPCYDIEQALITCSRNLERNIDGKKDTVKIGFLAERFDCDFFNKIKSGEIPFNNCQIKASPENGALIINSGQLIPLYLITGRQIVTREKLELLALTLNEKIEDGMPAAEVIKKINELGGIAVLPWGLGKWLFKRGKTVKKLIDEAVAGNLLIGDSSLRPFLWYEPVFNYAMEKNIRVLAGSDPLPFKGDEPVMGSYISSFEGNFDNTCPVSSIRKIMKNSGYGIKNKGHRNKFFTVIKRLLRHKFSK